MSLFDFVKTTQYSVAGVEILIPNTVNLILNSGKKLRIDLSPLTQTQKDTLRTIFTKLLKFGITQKIDELFDSTEQELSDEIDALISVEETPE